MSEDAPRCRPHLSGAASSPPRGHALHFPVDRDDSPPGRPPVSPEFIQWHVPLLFLQQKDFCLFSPRRIRLFIPFRNTLGRFLFSQQHWLSADTELLGAQAPPAGVHKGGVRGDPGGQTGAPDSLPAPQAVSDLPPTLQPRRLRFRKPGPVPLHSAPRPSPATASLSLLSDSSRK